MSYTAIACSHGLIAKSTQPVWGGHPFYAGWAAGERAELQSYVQRLKTDHEEVTLLFRDLLIRVASFFRDRSTFEALERRVIPRLFEGKNADGTVRVWVPGCATGEEAYSLAILLREHMDGVPGSPKVQVFATDIDESAIGTARLGRYPGTLLEGLSAERRDRFFSLVQGAYAVSKEIRDLCTFSTHNLVRDPPFSRMHLVSCRNLLIYMNPELQAKVIPVFHYSLASGGILLLGGSDSVVNHADLFEPLDKAARIFQRRDVRGPELPLPLQRTAGSSQSTAWSPTRESEGERTKAGEENPTSGSGPRHSSSNGGAPESALDGPWSTPVEHLLGAVPISAESVAQLQGALVRNSEQLQSLVEEHQTALEELRSSNEELHSVNEEMQSTNEELETSKEELQSLNEELHTVNVRLTEKIEELDQANGDLRNLFDSTQIATVFIDRYLVIRSFTRAITALYNLIPSDQGRPLTDIVSRLDYGNLRDDVAHVLSVREPLERRVARADQSAHYIVLAERALVEADVRKDAFLATLSHELRNPLAPIRTAAQLLQSPHLGSDELLRAQAIIARQVRHMSSLLDDLLDVARITRGAFVLKKDYAGLQGIMEAAVEAAQPAIDTKEHTLRVEYPKTPTTLEADPVRMTQVLSNLLINAAKYTPRGGLVEMGSRLEAQGLVIFVRDNGAGLAAETIPNIFAMFTPVESELAGSEGGLGIGLALAKGLVELHGGRIAARSAGLGQGSEFMVWLPKSVMVEQAAQSGRAEETADHPSSRRVLIADDNKDAAETLGMLLRLSGHEVHLAHTGAEALEVADRVRPEIGVLDIGMPDLSGYELAQRIRREGWGQKMTLIALTGWGQEDDKRRAFAAGFDHHCTKPVDPADLERFIAS